jgi:hypothetical protein
VPFVLTTGYDQSVIPSRFQHVPRCEKPVHMVTLARLIAGVIHSSSGSGAAPAH